MSENPLVALVQMRQARHPQRFPWAQGALLCGVLYLLAVPFITMLPLSGGVPERLGFGFQVAWLLGTIVGTCLLALALPQRHLSQAVLTVVSLRNGRALEETLGSRTSPAQLVDGLARHTAWCSLRDALTASPGLYCAWLVGLGLAGADVWSGAQWLARAAGLWLVLLGPLVWSSFYMCLAWELQAWEHRRSLAGVVAGMVLAGAFGPALGILVFTGVLGLAMVVAPQVSLSGLACLGASMLTYGLLNWLVARRLALHGLLQSSLGQRMDELSRRWSHHHRKGWIRPWSSNPIVVRETFRDAQGTPGGPMGWLVLRLSALWMVPAGVLLLVHWGAGVSQAVWAVALPMLVTQWCLASRRTMGAVVSEAEHSTLEVLRTTRLTAVEFCDGWALVGLAPRLLEQALLFPALGALLWTVDQSPRELAALGLVALLAGGTCLFAVYAGLCASLAQNRRLAHERLSTILVGGVALLAAASALGWYDLGWPALLGALILPVLWALGLRREVVVRLTRG